MFVIEKSYTKIIEFDLEYRYVYKNANKWQYIRDTNLKNIFSECRK